MAGRNNICIARVCHHGASGSLSPATSRKSRPGLLGFVVLLLYVDPPRTAAKHNIVKNVASRNAAVAIR